MRINSPGLSETATNTTALAAGAFHGNARGTVFADSAIRFPTDTRERRKTNCEISTTRSGIDRQENRDVRVSSSLFPRLASEVAQRELPATVILPSRYYRKLSS